MKIAGFHSGHECSYCIVENGVPILHAELERYIRLKEPFGDGLGLLFEDYKPYEEIKYFTHTLCTWKGGIRNRHPETYKKMWSIINKNDGQFFAPGHHQAHAASAFYLSKFQKALIVTIDGGGREYYQDDVYTMTTTFWLGEDNKISPIAFIPDRICNIGAFWSSMTKHVFGLSVGYPKGHQAGTVMAMSAFGDPKKYYDRLNASDFRAFDFDYDYFIREVENSSNPEQTKFDIAAALQLFTENFVMGYIKAVQDQFKISTDNLCLSGGVALNSVMIGRIYKEMTFKGVYVDPVPYDGGLPIGSALYVYYDILGNQRLIDNNGNVPYLGYDYFVDDIHKAIDSAQGVFTQEANNDTVVDLLMDQKIVSVFAGGSESGRRALGNRSILADPRSPDMKDRVNEKVKHRQWFRPFAPSILREEVLNWFERDVDSPYMSFVLKFKPEMAEKVPAVVHKDGSARLQTVTEKNNFWYYNFLKHWYKKSGVPLILNTSFNDQEPIVETPQDAVNCFLKTDIDYLYFADIGLLVGRK